tara:strand:+ start:1053 stop:1334 length:282 start_codon:yes stop_codon:yes gene_type:complete
MKFETSKDVVVMEVETARLHEVPSNGLPKSQLYLERAEAESMIDYLENCLCEMPADPFGSTDEEIAEMELICSEMGYGDMLHDEERAKYNGGE